jgi:transposase-like protein
MGRKPFKSPDEKLAIVLSVLKGETSQVEVARRSLDEPDDDRKWHKQFLEGGRESALARIKYLSSRYMYFGLQCQSRASGSGS